MSILYEYLKVLEKKKGGLLSGGQVNAGIHQKKKVIVLPYFIVASIFLFAAGVLLLFFKQIKNNFIFSTVKIDNKQESAKLSRDYVSSSVNSINNLDFSLSGIIYNSDSPSAIINGKLVEKNGKFGDWQVIQISPSEVKLENVNNQSELTLKLLLKGPDLKISN